jgi:hypothetical protein
MSHNAPPTAPSWWQTLPGILTGIAATVTAITGLIVAFNRTGRRSEQVQPASAVTAGAPSASARQPQPPSPGGATSADRTTAVALPLNRVKLAGGAADITILSAQIEPIDLTRRSLKFRVRYLNNGRYPSNFWSASYRLLLDDVPLAPTNLLDEVVDSNSAKEGDVVFEVPVSAKDATLQISAGDEKSRIPFKLP